MAKKLRFSGGIEESLLEEKFACITDSIKKMAAEAREDRQELNILLKNLLHGLQKKL